MKNPHANVLMSKLTNLPQVFSGGGIFPKHVGVLIGLNYFHGEICATFIVVAQVLPVAGIQGHTVPLIKTYNILTMALIF